MTQLTKNCDEKQMFLSLVFSHFPYWLSCRDEMYQNDPHWKRNIKRRWRLNKSIFFFYNFSLLCYAFHFHRSFVFAILFLSFYSGIKSLIAAKCVRKKQKSISIDQYHTDIFFFFSLWLSISAFEEVRIIERVLSKSFITVVSDQTPRKLNVLDIKRGTELHTYKYATDITAVRISRSVRKEYCIFLLFEKVNSF